MKAKLLFLLAIIVIAALAVSCQKDEIFDPANHDGLYLKSAASGEVVRMYYINPETGNGGIFYYPADMLFVVEADKAELLNGFMLKIEDFHILDEGKAVFRISEFDSKALLVGTAGNNTIYTPSSENVYADKLPFSKEDYDAQGNDATNRFGGLIKADRYVFAIKNGSVTAYDLIAGKIFSTDSRLDGDTWHIILKEDPTFLSLRYLETSPIGNVFSLSWSGGNRKGYTIAR